MPGCPLRRTCARPLEGASTAKAKRGGLRADLIAQRLRVLIVLQSDVIVPMLCVGMPPGTLCVPLSTSCLSLAQG
ncbi:hypothetical protein EMIT0P294_10967 [Pseudomonas sp. IT-P294]